MSTPHPDDSWAELYNELGLEPETLAPKAAEPEAEPEAFADVPDEPEELPEAVDADGESEGESEGDGEAEPEGEATEEGGDPGKKKRRRRRRQGAIRRHAGRVPGVVQRRDSPAAYPLVMSCSKDMGIASLFPGLPGLPPSVGWQRHRASMPTIWQA